MDKLEKVYAEFVKKAEDAGYSKDDLVLGTGCLNRGVVLIGEAPGKEEIEKKRPFSGKAGKILDDFLAASGILREELFITNTVKFRPYKISAKGTVSNRPPSAYEIEFCASCLKAELSAISPRLVITLGNTPLKAVLGDKQAVIGDYHGKILFKGSFSVYPMYHPASLIYNRSLVPVYNDDMKRLKNLI